MPPADTTLDPGLMPALRRMVRGLSLLFWGLPLALVVAVGAVFADWFRPLGEAPALAAAGMLLYGVHLLATFRPAEPPWQSAVDRARMLALAGLGLAPFLHWWNSAPSIDVFFYSLVAYAATAFLFLLNLNFLLQRLAAMMPDPILREDTRLFARINLSLLLMVLALLLLYLVAAELAFRRPPPNPFLEAIQKVNHLRRELFVSLVLLPLATTMSMLWKTKEAVLSSVFSQVPSLPIESQIQD